MELINVRKALILRLTTAEWPSSRCVWSLCQGHELVHTLHTAKTPMPKWSGETLVTAIQCQRAQQQGPAAAPCCILLGSFLRRDHCHDADSAAHCGAAKLAKPRWPGKTTKYVKHFIKNLYVK